MKVYLLINNFAFDGTPDCNVLVFAERKDAENEMLIEFEEYKNEYLGMYSESSVVIEEPTSLGACIYLDGDYNEKHDEWKIVEKEVL